MTDHSLPDYNSEPSEFESVKKVEFPRHILVQIKMHLTKIHAAHTLQAFTHIVRDIQQGSLANNAAAKEQLKRAVNQRARELGHTEGNWW